MLTSDVNARHRKPYSSLVEMLVFHPAYRPTHVKES